MNGGPKPPKDDDELTAILQKYGAEHEQRYFEALKNQLEATGRQVIDLDVKRDHGGHHGIDEVRVRAGLVASAFSGGPDALYQPTFFREEDGLGWIGRADFLVPTDTPSVLGHYSFEPYDTKLARIAKVNALLQLCSYAEHIASIQGTEPDEVHIVTGSEEEGTVSVRLSEVSAYFRHVKEAFQQSLAAGFADATEPEPVEHCNICRWSRVCNKRWRDDDDITFVAGVTNAYRDVLRASGVSTLADLANATEIPTDMSVETFDRLRSQAKLQLLTREAKAADPQATPVYEFTRPIRERRGFNLLPEPTPGDIFYDIEGHPYRGSQGLEYLHGLAWVAEDGSLQYEAIWAHDEASERSALQKVVDFIHDRIDQPGGQDLRVYHFGHYEPSALRRLATRYATYETKLTRLFRESRFVDLSRVVNHALRIGIESYSIKKLEDLYGFTRDDLVEEGGLSIIHYERWLQSRNNGLFDEHGDTAILDELVRYNRNDCFSTVHLRTWLENRRAELVSLLDEEESRTLVRPTLNIINDEETIGEGLVNQLNIGRFDPDLSEADSDRLAHRWLLADLLDFHKREDAVTRFEIFQLVNKTEAELLQDANVIAGLRYERDLDGPKPRGKRQVVVRRYRFDPQQDIKIDAEDTIRATNFYVPPGPDGEKGPSTSVKFVDLDVDSGIVDLEISSTEPGLPHPDAVYEYTYINKDGFTNALVELAEVVLNDEPDTYRATRDLLRRTPPRLRTLKLTDFADSREVNAESIGALAADLDQSYFVIQGPPGTGKTYSSARAILQLVQQHHRIGIAANTHSAVEQLLQEIAAHAGEFGFSSEKPLKILHKPKGAAANAFSPQTDTVDVTASMKNDEVSAAADNHHIIASTSFLFTSTPMRNRIDILFIDEAGQLSLADTLGASLSTKNLVLVGDPQQLKQPTKAAHPGQSGLSGLEYINQDADVVPADYGVLLRTTRRMHPTITKFVSEQVYEGKLLSDDACVRQEIEGAGPFSGSGLRWIPVNHRGRSTHSQEEVDVVVDIYFRLIGSTFVDKHGDRKPITGEDLFVIAPYNHQVQRLRNQLEAHELSAKYGISKDLLKRRVGTVDKAQGDEAPIVIVSYTSSSSEDIPRGMDFHYSKNRFNVAISRAKALAIVVANPALLDVECTTIEQVKLANMLCRYEEVAESVTLETQAT